MVGLYHGSCNNVYGRIRNEYINNEALSGVCCNYCHPLDEAAFVLGYLRRPGGCPHSVRSPCIRRPFHHGKSPGQQGHGYGGLKLLLYHLSAAHAGTQEPPKAGRTVLKLAV